VTTTEFRYQGEAIVEEKVNGAVARSFVVDEAGSIVKMTIPSGANAGDYLVSWNGHGDALHLLRIKADGSTELANTFTYSTWGTPTVDGTHNNSANGGADYGDLGFRYLYVGEFDVQWDNAFGLGLHYMHARHYAPALGRFLQPDPAGLEDSLYAYAANNPVTEMDPDGTCFIVCLAIGAVVDTALYLATTDSEDWDFGDAVSTVAMGAAESMVNPFAKIGKAAKLVSAAGKLLSKVPTATRVVKDTARAVKRATSARNNTVYVAGTTRRPTYVGITSNYPSRAAQHYRTGRTVRPTTITNVSRFDAHAVEQAMINKHRLASNGGTLTNKINSVSRRDVLHRVYVWRGNNILRKHGLD
jgi:RHS repeat-associated protein